MKQEKAGQGLAQSLTDLSFSEAHIQSDKMLCGGSGSGGVYSLGKGQEGIENTPIETLKVDILSPL